MASVAIHKTWHIERKLLRGKRTPLKDYKKMINGSKGKFLREKGKNLIWREGYLEKKSAMRKNHGEKRNLKSIWQKFVFENRIFEKKIWKHIIGEKHWRMGQIWRGLRHRSDFFKQTLNFWHSLSVSLSPISEIWLKGLQREVRSICIKPNFFNLHQSIQQYSPKYIFYVFTIMTRSM